MPILGQDGPEIKPCNGGPDCHVVGPICRREHYCAVCAFELTHKYRVAVGNGTYVHPRCVGKKKKVWR
jgi:hypothetical protein